jgi:pimeloyl-ACP methyl ester carboxylesterase
MELIVNKQKVFIATGGKEFNVNKPALVMLHGAGMDHTVWSMQARYFAHHGFSVLNPDLPGHGRSDGPPPASIEEYMKWVLRLIVEVKAREIHLIGHSMGSLIALASSAELGEKMVKQALLGTLPHIQVHPNLLEAAKKK